MGRNKKEETDASNKDKAQNILKSVLKDTRIHFNNIIPKSYTVSTGSLNLDLELGGGIKPCVLRASGMSEAGKTSFTLNIIKNFLEEKNKKRRSIYFLSDKEFSEEMIKRSGVNFVDNVDDFVDGTCYIIRTNIYETVCNTIKQLIEDRDIEYIFALDSMDNFAPKSALDVDFGESFQKGGTSAITAHFFRCFNILLPRLGHIVIMISQYRDSVVIGRQHNPIFKQTNSSGGRALEHGVVWALEFIPAQNSKEDMFWEGTPWQSKKIGHNCTVQLKKSPNEKTGVKVKYPIVYGRSGGKSIWIEKEIYSQLLIWQMLKIKGSWIEFNESLLEDLQKIDNEFPKQIQGEDQLVKLLESKPKVTSYLYNKFKDILSKDS